MHIAGAGPPNVNRGMPSSADIAPVRAVRGTIWIGRSLRPAVLPHVKDVDSPRHCLGTSGKTKPSCDCQLHASSLGGVAKTPYSDLRSRSNNWRAVDAGSLRGQHDFLGAASGDSAAPTSTAGPSAHRDWSYVRVRQSPSTNTTMHMTAADALAAFAALTLQCMTSCVGARRFRTRHWVSVLTWATLNNAVGLHGRA